MSPSLVVVAIPAENDRVWKVSSEKVPHLTLLYLGDEANADTQQIVQFVEHAVTLSERGPFYLDIDHRGTLGEAEADVLFFSKRSWNLKWIKQFRGQLLQNESVRTAFDSAEQHLEAPQEWLPHLTLGYPETPAKELPPENDYPLYSVEFDRIAVWWAEDEGPEFRLEWPDRPEELEGPMAVAWADEQKRALMHYGVKGMRWGVRKSEGGGTGDTLSVIKEVVKRGAKATDNALFEAQKDQDHIRQEIVVNASKKLKTDLPNIKEKHGDYGKLRNRVKKPFSPEAKAYRQDVKKAYATHLESSANEITNIQKSRQYTIRDHKGQPNTTKHFWTVETQEIKHADEVTLIHVIYDDEGYITDLEPVKDEMAQSAEHGEVFVAGLVHGAMSPGEQFILEHYGVKGMRWGHRDAGTVGLAGGSTGRAGGAPAPGFRREAPVPVAPKAESKVPHGNRRKTKVDVDGGQNHPATKDALKVAEAQAKLKKSGPKALTNQELRDVATRVQLEQQAVQATRGGANKFTRETITSQGKQAVNQLIRSKIDATINPKKNK